MNLDHPLTKRRLGLIEAATSVKALTYKEIASATCTSPPRVLKVMQTLRRLDMVHVERWVLSTNTYAAAYRWGQGKDAPRPRPMTGTEGQRAYRERIRKDPDANALFPARQRAKDRAKSAASRPRSWAAMLFVGVRLPSMNAEG